LYGRTGINAFDLYFDTVFDGRTGDNDFDFDFGTVFDGRTGTTTILRSRQLKLLSYSSTASNTVQAIAATIFVALTVTLLRLMFSYVTPILQSKRLDFLSHSPIGAIDAVGRDTDFHIIDQGKVGYLYHLQILLFYNLQDENNINGVNNVTISDVVTMTAFHEMPSAFHNGIIATNNDAVSSTAVTIMTTVFDGRTGNNDGISSAAIADKAQYDYYDGDTGNESLATVTLRTYDTVHNLYFDITFDTALHTAIDTTFTSASHVSPSYDIDSTSSAIYDEDSSVVTTSPSVSIADEATSSVTLSTRDFDIALKTYDTVYDSYFDSIFDAAFNTTKVIDSTSKTFLSYDIDSSSSSAAVTIMTTVFDGRTGDNDFDLHFDSVATFILILTSLMLVIVLIHISILSLVDVYSSYDVYCTSGECVVVRKWVQSPEWRFP